MNLKFLTLLICKISITAVLSAQKDSVHTLPAIHIKKQSALFFGSERAQRFLSQKEIRKSTWYDLGDILQYNTTAHILTNGSLGGNSSISIRGTESDHTIIKWNGININSITLGSADLSGISGNIIGNIHIVYSGAASLYGSGTFGGAVLINSAADWNNRAHIRYNFEYGSLQSTQHKVHASWGNKRFQYQLQTFFHQAKNDFLFIDIFKTNHPRIRQTNNALTNIGIIQNIFIRLPKNHWVEIGLWHQKKNKEIPPIMGSFVQSNKVQQDETLKSYIKWNKQTQKSILSGQLSYVYDYLWYTDKDQAQDSVFTVNSKIRTHRINTLLDYRYTWNTYVTTNIGVEYSLNQALVKNYGGKIARQEGSIFLALQGRYKKLVTNISARQDIYDIYIPRPLFGFGLTYIIPKTKEHLAIQFSYADKYRIPDFNELYWKPGGNIKLKPESGWGVDIGTTINFLPPSTSKHKLYSQSTFYQIQIKDHIIWSPNKSGVWTAENLKKTRSRGLEQSIVYTLKQPKIEFSARIDYHFNKSILLASKDNQGVIGNILRYKPLHTVKSSIHFTHKYIHVSLYGQYISKQFSDDDNSHVFSLASYFLAHLYLSTQITHKRTEAQFYIKVNNLTNTSYQSIRNFAQPGIQLLIGANIQLNQKNY